MNTSTPAVVLNMFYSGLGIARSLGRRGIPVIGLSAQRGVYGNLTRYAKVLEAPDSRLAPGELAAYLVTLGKTFDGRKAVLFPTRDHDVVCLDRHREQLELYYSLVIPPPDALETALNKWETDRAARRGGVASPRTWLIESESSLTAAAGEAAFPCVLKPLEAHHWRAPGNWAAVGGRKAVGIGSADELRREYAQIAVANTRALLQEMVPGGDDALFAVGCYFGRDGRFAGGFTVQKLIQSPALFGTGCVLQTVHRPDLVEQTRRLLESIGYSGIAEVEYKNGQLIEINPRPWDQHTLGWAAGVDVIHMAYCDHADLPIPSPGRAGHNHKWLAEDSFLIEAVRTAGRGDARFWQLMRVAAGRRTHAIWWWRDPLPFGGYLMHGLPSLLMDSGRAAASALRGKAEAT